MLSRPCTILLADDDPDDRNLFREAVGSVGKKVNLLEAGNGQETLDLLHDSSTIPDFIVLDINMPLVSGIDCLKMIRADARFSYIPVVIMSTSANEVTIVTAKAAGATRYVIKPTSFEELAAIIRYMCTVDLRHSGEDEFILNNVVAKIE